MLVSGVLFVLFGIVVTIFAVGAARLTAPRRPRRARTWPAATRSVRSRVIPSHTYAYWNPDWAAAEASLARHPAGRSRRTPIEGCVRLKGPDDDPEFLRLLEQRIRQMRGDSTD